MSYFRRQLRNFSAIAGLPHCLERKSVKFKYNSEQINFLSKLRDAFMNPLIFLHYVLSKLA